MNKYKKFSLKSIVLFLVFLTGILFTGKAQSLVAVDDEAHTGPLETVRTNVILNDILTCNNYTLRIITSLDPTTGTVSMDGDHIIFAPSASCRDTTVSIRYGVTCNGVEATATLTVIVSMYNLPANIIPENSECLLVMPETSGGTLSARVKFTTVTTIADCVFAFSSPLVGDLNGDGKPEIIALGSPNATNFEAFGGNIIIFDGQTGNIIKKYTLYNSDNGQFRLTNTSHYHNSLSHLALADLDNDGLGEIVVAETGSNGKVYALKPALNPTAKSIDSLTVMWNASVSHKAPLKSDFTEYGMPMPYIADLNADGIPEVIVYNKIYNGATGALLMAYGGAASTPTASNTSAQLSTTEDVAVFASASTDADDDRAEIRSSAYVGRRAGTADAGAVEPYLGVITVMDIDGDGKQEIIAGSRIYKFNINSLTEHTQNTYTTIEGPQSVSIGSTKYHLLDGFTRVADIDMDGELDIIMITKLNTSNNPSQQLIAVWNTSNPTVVKAASYFETRTTYGTFSIPFIGDINNRDDGNGKKLPEICIVSGALSNLNSTATTGSYHPKAKFPTSVRFGNNTSGRSGHIFALTYDVNETTITKRLKLSWAMEHDDDSNDTGISMFDFDNDGTKDLCYRDKSSIRVISPAKGTNDYVGNNNSADAIILSASAMHATGYEVTVVADVNFDGSADIVTTQQPSTNNYQRYGMVRVYEYKGTQKWAPCPPVWNQGLYDPLQIRENLQINARPQSMLSKYILNGQEIYPYNGAWIQQPIVKDGDEYRPIYRLPDAVINNMDVNVESTNETKVTLKILNKGTASINANTPIAFYNGGATDSPLAGSVLIGSQPVDVDIFPEEEVELTYTISGNFNNCLIRARIMDDGVTFPAGYDDCDTSNNEGSGADCPFFDYRIIATPDTLICGHGGGKPIQLWAKSYNQSVHPNPTFQWYKNGKTIPGATDSVYFVSEVGDAGNYTCFVTENICRNYTPVKTLTVEYMKANNDSVSITGGITTPINVLNNDSSPATCTPTVGITENPKNGVVSVNAANEILYTADANFSGDDSLTYNIVSGVTAKVYISVTGIPVRYVKQGGTGDGVSWATASGNLQDMINKSGIGGQVWVAEGTYIPVWNAQNWAKDNYPNSDGLMHNAFVMKDNVKIYGGFDGTEINITQRNWKLHKTTLSGDRGTENDYSDNCYHVVIAADVTNTAVLDGFSIIKGNAAGAGGNITVNGMTTINQRVGGGMIIASATPTLNNLIVSGNMAGHADGRGGGIGITTSSPTLTNMLVSGNMATAIGGGIYVVTSSPTLINVTVSGNRADKDNNNNGGGGGIANNTSSTSRLINTIVQGNSVPDILSFTVDDKVIYSNSLVGTIIGGSIDNQGNLTTTPQFAQLQSVSAAPTIDGDYSLMRTSPCIDKGDNDAVTTDTDLAGNARIIGAKVDIGAYEIPLCNIASANDITADGKTICYGETATLSASSNVPDALFKWYDSQTSNMVLSSDENYTTPALTATTIYYVSVSGTDYCENVAGNRKEVKVTVDNCPDLKLTKTSDVIDVCSGNDIVFTINVKNNAAITATGVIVIDTLPSELTYVSNSGGYNEVTNEWTTGDIAAGATATLTITAKVDTAGNIVNKAYVAAVNGYTYGDYLSAPADMRDEKQVVSVDLPEINLFTYGGNPAEFCTNHTGTIRPILVATNTSGTYSVAPSGLTIDTSTGMITPSASTPDVYTVTYTIAASHGCGEASKTAPVKIETLLAATDIRVDMCPSPEREVRMTSFLDSVDNVEIEWQKSNFSTPDVDKFTGIVNSMSFKYSSVYTYEYSLTANCGSSTAVAYINILDDKLIDRPDTIVICRNQDMSRTVQLNQILGLELGGTWEYPVNPENTVSSNVKVFASNSKYHGAYIFNAQKAWQEALNSEYDTNYNGYVDAKKFVFRYVAPQGSCVENQSKTFVIVVTEKIRN